MPIVNSYIDECKVRNTTNKPISIGDLVNLSVPPGQTVDLLKIPRVTKEKINQSKDLVTAINIGILQLIKSATRSNIPAPIRKTIIANLEDIDEELDITSKSVVITSPNANEELPLWLTETAITILEIRGLTNAGTITFSSEVRNASDAYGVGTSIPSASIIANSNSVIQAGFNKNVITAGKWIVLISSASSGSPTQLTVTFKYQQ